MTDRHGAWGAIVEPGGVRFRVFASRAQRVELCLFDDARNETRRLELEPGSEGDWSAFVPGCAPGQRYGYRVHGRWAPREGLRHNPAKLLLDPYALALEGAFRWTPALLDYADGDPWGAPDTSDSAADVALSVVAGPAPRAQPGPRVPWADTVLFEANVRGYTMRHPALAGNARGKFAGMRHAAVLGHIKALGVTAVELMPVHALVDEARLVRMGLRNLWGYNPVAFFVPDARFAQADPRAEFVDMVNAIHDAGLEVILDVVYNHTAESDEYGPSLSFRGLDNAAWYRLEAGDPGRWVNDTGCGNTLNADHPRVRELVLDSLAYWHRALGVDGFRFDLATVLGRHANGFATGHPLLQAIAGDPRLAGAKLVAEPWDPGPGGYRLGQFPAPFAELNDRYRDTVRRCWRGEPGLLGDLAARLHGSADLFEAAGRAPWASVNMVTNHDGFTLADLVSYEHRHNEANGEHNRDGHAHNHSANHGVEGPTGDPAILALRRRQRLNLLATLLCSQGTPLLLAGDEMGNSQLGNNNAYAQDNDIGWVDWSGLAADPGFTAAVAALIALRRRLGLLRRAGYAHDAAQVAWLRPDGEPMAPGDWAGGQGMLMRLAGEGEALLVLVHLGREAPSFTLPEAGAGRRWQQAFSTFEGDAPRSGPGIAVYEAVPGP